ncbi:MAG: hypothetical protein KatS3mg114_0606 [Planctomycetaceae bacterium]|nr:MAG: hypothetical protein KatS3mg114_0606 [Planctomycetaceae bacterium]
MAKAEQYLKPEVIRQVARLDLRARFIVEGFLSGLHASPFHGFSVEFSEHRRYAQGDDPKDIDWLVYAKTDRYYVKKYQAETNISGYLLMDLSASMGFTYRQQLTKFDYCICLAAALAYLMIHQQDPVGVMTFGETLQASLDPRSKRTQLANILAVLARARPAGITRLPENLQRVASMIRHRSLLMLFSDLLCEPEPVWKTPANVASRRARYHPVPCVRRGRGQFPVSWFDRLRRSRNARTFGDRCLRDSRRLPRCGPTTARTVS